MGYDISCVTGETYPVNLVQVVRLQDNAADDTLARSDSHLDIDTAEEDVEVGLDGGSITLLGHGELGAIVAKVDLASSGLEARQSALALGEVGIEVSLLQAGVVGAGF